MMRHRLTMVAAVVALSALALGAGSARSAGTAPGAVYAQTNDAAGNQIVAYSRAGDGKLTLLGRFATGGYGTSRIRLSSQGSVVLSKNNRWLYVANVGSSEISVFAVSRDGLRLVDKVSSGGQTPNSITVDGNLLYVLNNGDAGAGNITGFHIGHDGTLTQLAGSTRPLSGLGTNPAQISFTPDGSSLIVTEKATNLLDTYSVDKQGYATGPVTHASSGVTPFGFDFTRSGAFVVTEAFGGVVGQAAASSYSLAGPAGFTTLSGSIADGRSEVCWTKVTKDGKYAYVTNFGDGTISSYSVAANGSIALLNPIAATTTLGQLSIRDENLSQDGRYLYAIDITSQKVHGWSVNSDGSLTSVGAFAGLPGTVAGIAAS